MNADALGGLFVGTHPRFDVMERVLLCVILRRLHF